MAQWRHPVLNFMLRFRQQCMRTMNSASLPRYDQLVTPLILLIMCLLGNNDRKRGKS